MSVVGAEEVKESEMTYTNVERWVRKCPGSVNYCSTCGFNLDHISKDFRWKKNNSNKNDEHSIANQEGGSTRNCLH